MLLRVQPPVEGSVMLLVCAGLVHRSTPFVGILDSTPSSRLLQDEPRQSGYGQAGRGSLLRTRQASPRVARRGPVGRVREMASRAEDQRCASLPMGLREHPKERYAAERTPGFFRDVEHTPHSWPSLQGPRRTRRADVCRSESGARGSALAEPRARRRDVIVNGKNMT